MSVTTEVQQSFQETINLRSNAVASVIDNEGSIPAWRIEVRLLPAFTDLLSRLEKFSGKSREGDFEIWLGDYLEATQDCEWSDKQRAHWFSWFITGLAKLMWQCTLLTEEKSSWESIVAPYKGQFGIHIDPRTAYQHCQELQYEQSNSVQGLMSLMREYKEMAPTMLTDAVLESILWNKVPVSLHQEVKELIVGNVQALLQKLLSAESVIWERSRWFGREQKESASVQRRLT